MMQQMVLDFGAPHVPNLGNFFVGPNNAVWSHLNLWLDACFETASVGQLPTYLWGATGCGKTHLLKAIRFEFQNRGARVGWMDAHTTHPAEFDSWWMAVLMDDVHLYGPAQQQAAFNWFVNTQTHGCSVLAAGALPTTDLTLRDDLRTRLAWGHVFALQPLNDDQRRDVLRAKAHARGVALSDDVIDYMLTRFSRDLTSLTELLDQMDGYAMQTKRTITIPLIRSMMDDGYTDSTSVEPPASDETGEQP